MITAEIFAPISRRQSADLEMDRIDFATLETCLYCSLLAGTQPALHVSIRDFQFGIEARTAVTVRANVRASLDLANVTLNAHTRPAQRPRSTNMNCSCNAGHRL